jgi:hypothetical protein
MFTEWSSRSVDVADLVRGYEYFPSLTWVVSLTVEFRTRPRCGDRRVNLGRVS